MQQAPFPLSFIDVANPLGWDYKKEVNGDQTKYSQKQIIHDELGEEF